MKGCNGACDQGRRLCPHPTACEIPEPLERRDLFLPVLQELIFMCAVVVTLLALVALVVMWWKP